MRKGLIFGAGLVGGVILILTISVVIAQSNESPNKSILERLKELEDWKIKIEKTIIDSIVITPSNETFDTLSPQWQSSNCSFVLPNRGIYQVALTAGTYQVPPDKREERKTLVRLATQRSGTSSETLVTLAEGPTIPTAGSVTITTIFRVDHADEVKIQACRNPGDGVKLHMTSITFVAIKVK